METITLSNMNEIKVSYSNPVPVIERIQFTQSAEAAKYLRTIWDNTMDLQECFKVLYLNRAGHLLGHYNLSSGALTGCVVDKRLIFGVAVKIAATLIIVAHNHPSGNLIPSIADRKITKEINNIAELFDIKLADHIILTTEGFYSFRDNGAI